MPYNQSLLNNLDHIEYANMLVDVSSTLTYIPSDTFYGHFSPRLTNAIGGETVADPQGYDTICYKDLNLERVPDVTFRFIGDNVVVPRRPCFWKFKKGCLA
ncbi:hypothetical protein L1987_79617 [Smallanthus sonchifolius]|uniref:Uncharacterized protein n=2 Tax=Smallanthus sonchifolius TaxID=185202 RepID=A0ACB8YKK9_9ASTR|nr:hypothetical protein L1987_79612 [Smallanthus sonchifolius]KAI3685948.1 hypothetical protein L1987_79617 [Smallanthus sonchifolius]